jgi:hypothetical protein
MVGVAPLGHGAVIHHNTILSGYGGGASVIFMNSLTIATVIENNVLAGNQASAVIMDSYACAGDGPVASLRDNVAFNYNWQLYYEGSGGGSCTAGTGFQGDNTLQNEFLTNCTPTTTGNCAGFGGTVAIGNDHIQSTCAGDPGCIVMAGCTSVDACFSGLFATWDAPSYGKKDEFTVPSGGWLLKAGDPCKVVKSGLGDTAAVPQDLFGTPRTSPPSMGAHEFDGSCL